MDLTHLTDGRLSVNEFGPQNYEYTNDGFGAFSFTFYFLRLYAQDFQNFPPLVSPPREA